MTLLQWVGVAVLMGSVALALWDRQGGRQAPRSDTACCASTASTNELPAGFRALRFRPHGGESVI